MSDTKPIIINDVWTLKSVVAETADIISEIIGGPAAEFNCAADITPDDRITFRLEPRTVLASVRGVFAAVMDLQSPGEAWERCKRGNWTSPELGSLKIDENDPAGTYTKALKVIEAGMLKYGASKDGVEMMMSELRPAASKSEAKAIFPDTVATEERPDPVI